MSWHDAYYADPAALGGIAGIDRIAAETFSSLDMSPVVVIEAGQPGAIDAAQRLAELGSALIVGLARHEIPPDIRHDCFDIFITGCPGAPRPWVSIQKDRLEREVDHIVKVVRHSPVAASVLRRVLKMNQTMTFTDAIHLESLAYSTLLGGGEFAHWLAARPAMAMPKFPSLPVEVDRDDDHLIIRLADPENRNAMSAPMRDALYNMLVNALEDPTQPSVELRGKGKCFSTGGSLAEFGRAGDLARAHAVRTMRSCAEILHAFGDRAEVIMHGACVGSGLEVPAAAAVRRAMRDAWFQLPELSMGLIPGAGGTASISRAIGRHRACYMAVSGRRIDARVALDWGLVSDIVEDQASSSV